MEFPLAGMYLEDVPFAVIGDRNEGTNVFENLNNGIVTYNTNLTVRNSTFERMVWEQHFDDWDDHPNDGWWVVPGIAIDTYRGTVEFEGLGDNSTSAPVFQDMQHGIYTIESIPIVSESRFLNVDRGVYVRGIYSGLDISNNRFDYDANFSPCFTPTYSMNIERGVLEDELISYNVIGDDGTAETRETDE